MENGEAEMSFEEVMTEIEKIEPVTFVFVNGETVLRKPLELGLSRRSPETGEERVLITPPPRP